MLCLFSWIAQRYSFVCSFVALKSYIEVSEDGWSPGNLAIPVEVTITSVVVFLLSAVVIMLSCYSNACSWLLSLLQVHSTVFFRAFWNHDVSVFIQWDLAIDGSICVLRSYFISPGSGQWNCIKETLSGRWVVLVF